MDERAGRGGRGRARLGLLAVAVAMVVGSTVVPGGAVTPVATVGAAGLTTCPVWTPTNLQCNQYPAAGPLGAIGVIGDSVLLGSGDGMSTPGLPRQLADAGWGPVNFLAAKGYTTGRNRGGGQPNTAAYWINRWRAEGFDPPVMMVNFGNNDMGYCPPLNVACMKQTIDYLLDVIGPQTEVWWPTSAGVDYNRVGPWNSALSLAAQERPNLHVWDWQAAFANANPPFAHDKYFIHLANGANYARRSAMMAADVTTVFGPSRRVGPDVGAATASGTPSDYQPVDIGRVDSRYIAAGTIATIDLNGLAPADATGVALTLEPHDSSGPGYLTSFPCDEGRSLTSNVNFVAGQRRAAQTLVRLTAARTMCIFSYAGAYVDIDVQGWFVAGSASRLTGLAPTRLLDTRETGRQDVDVIQAPAGATAVAVSLVGLNSGVDAALTAWACDAPRPDIAQVRFSTGEIIAGAAFVKTSAAGTICVAASAPADVVVDLTGVFSVDGRLRYTPTVVQRMIDTREGLGGWLGRITHGQQVDMHPAPAGAEAVSGTLTMVEPTIAGWLRATPCGVSQLSSSVNSPAGGIVANSLTVAVAADQGLCVEPWRGAHVLFDISGGWAP